LVKRRGKEKLFSTKTRFIETLNMLYLEGSGYCIVAYGPIVIQLIGSEKRHRKTFFIKNKDSLKT